MLRILRTVLLASAVVLLGGCADTGTTVSCRGRLQPINVPTAVKVVLPEKPIDGATPGDTP